MSNLGNLNRPGWVVKGNTATLLVRVGGQSARDVATVRADNTGGYEVALTERSGPVKVGREIDLDQAVNAAEGAIYRRLLGLSS